MRSTKGGGCSGATEAWGDEELDAAVAVGELDDVPEGLEVDAEAHRGGVGGVERGGVEDKTLSGWRQSCR
jgi:hypothetical protein